MKFGFQYPVLYMRWALITLLSLLPLQYLSEIQVTPVNFVGEPFKQVFNEDKDIPRLVAVYSPT
ncbi:MAG: hypothetical protein P8Y94_17665 [Acidobacteriota bacterium]